MREPSMRSSSRPEKRRVGTVCSPSPTRSASPVRKQTNDISSLGEGETLTNVDGDLVARKAGMGRLLKSAKQDVQVPEFDMNAFF